MSEIKKQEDLRIDDETIIEAVDFDLDTETTFENEGQTDFFINKDFPAKNKGSNFLVVNNPIKEM